MDWNKGQVPAQNDKGGMRESVEAGAADFENRQLKDAAREAKTLWNRVGIGSGSHFVLVGKGTWLTRADHTHTWPHDHF